MYLHYISTFYILHIIYRFMIISIILVIICLLILSIVYKPSKIDTSFKLQIQPKTIIIIGTGLSAMIVALTIADLGHRAIIIDQTIDVHGSTSSYIGINCADTTIQKTYNISDHYSIFIKDEKVQDPLTQYLFKNSKNSIDWLSKKGIEFSDIYKLNKHSKARTHIFKNYKLTYILLNYIRTENEKISMIKNTSATSFIVDKNGKVDGIICEDGRLIFSNSIVITNDYNSLDLCKSIGGNITNLDKYTYNPINFIDSNGQLIYGYSDLLKTGIILNKYGKRFCNEHSNNKAIIKAMNRQISSNIFYLILPNENTLVKMFKSVLHPMTITDMSNFMNIDKKVLVNEFKQYKY